MAESRDSAIKLFGKTIPLQPCGESPPGSGGCPESGGEANKDLQNKEATPESKDQGHESPESEDKNDPPSSTAAGDTNRPCSSDPLDAPMLESKPEEESKDAGNSQEKTPKKPDKVLPCPRCNSLDTKFCYFNNYNVNQPRHFCKNCQRYWTAGGTMRNVPVGAGRRKNKNSASFYRHITLPDSALQAVHSDAAAAAAAAIHHPSLKPNGTVLSFGSDVPLCESMASVLDLAERATKSCTRNGFHQMEERMIPLSNGVGSSEEQSTGCSATASNSKEEGAKATSQHVPAPIPCLSGGSSLPFAWSPAPFCAPNLAAPFYPAAAYWGCAVPGSWNIQWLSPLASCSPNSGGSPGSGSNSPTLGKHSRDGSVLQSGSSGKGDNFQQITNQEKLFWIPKTLRIHDPEEAAKSSIWTMMGANKNEKANGISSGALFNAFQPKVDVKSHALETSQLFRANPAAFSRSLSFQESS